MMTDQTEHISHQAHEEIARDAYQAGTSAVQRIAQGDRHRDHVAAGAAW